jgi:hypothetical protein
MAATMNGLEPVPYSDRISFEVRLMDDDNTESVRR